MSYYVDYYDAQVRNGGFSQFAFNSGLNPQTISFVRQGLAAIGATGHLQLFLQGARAVALRESSIHPFLKRILVFLYKADVPLNTITHQFFDLQKTENLTVLNAAWLRSRPGLCTIPQTELEREVAARSARIPGLEARMAAAREATRLNEPDFKKAIRALCHAAGHTLEKITAGTPVQTEQGTTVLLWHFITDHELHYLEQNEYKIAMFHAETKQRVVELPRE